MTAAACSCGEAEPHVIAERRTADGIRVCFWSDGDITGGMGIYPRGVGRTGDPEVGRRVALEVGLYDWAEVGALIKRTRKAVSA